jgi:dTDP-glucose pyrophosphorylase
MKYESVSGPIQLILPMAGSGSRFKKSGYKDTKLLIPIHGIPMFKVVLGNLITEKVQKVVIITQLKLNLKSEIDKLKKFGGIEFEIIEIDYVTEGPASSVKLAKPFIDLDLPVVIANSDQYLKINMNNFYHNLIDSIDSGLILTMRDTDPKWSFVRLNDNGYVSEVREKEVISNIATVGIYGFKKGNFLFESIDRMIKDKNKVNNEYYVAPLFNYLVKDGHKISTYYTGPVNDVMFGLGIPEDYEIFLKNPISNEAALNAEFIN